MSAALHLARPEDLDRLAAMMAKRLGVEDLQTLYPTLAPILDGSPHGCAYLIGPARAPLGYLLLSFGWSVSRGGLIATLSDLFIRPAIRGRGIASEVLISLPKALTGSEIVALDIAVGPDGSAIESIASRSGYGKIDQSLIMSRDL